MLSLRFIRKLAVTLALLGIVGCGTPTSMSTLNGGNGVGNGGAVLVCQSSPSVPETWQLLDFFESREWQLPIDLGPGILDPTDKVKLALDRLKSIDSMRAAVYREALDSFLSNTAFVGNDIEFPSSNDYGRVQKPAYCHIEQAALQRPPVLPSDRYFNIVQSIWNLLDNDSRAGLILHEIVYQDALRRGHTDSLRSRYFNALINSTKVANLTAQTYRNEVISLRLDEFDDQDWIQKGMYRYFDKERLSWSDANKYCEDLVGPSYLWRIESVAQIPNMAFSKIGNQIIGPEGASSQRVWVSVRNASSGAYEPGIADLRLESKLELGGVNGSEKLPVICWSAE